MQKLLTLLLVFAMSSSFLFAQVGHGGLPFAIENGWNLDEVTTRTMPAVDAFQMDLIDQKFYMEKGRSIRFGEEHEVALNLDNSGEWISLANGDRVWRLKISCPNAFHINLIYDSFFMPKGARFYIYNSDASHVLGAFTSGNNKSYGTFSSGLVRGDETILEYYEPAAVKGEGKLSVSTVVHGYRNMFAGLEKGFGDSGSCNINVNCPEGADWQTIKTSVARIIAGGFDHCTGTMVNTVRQDCSPLFLTANHCAGGEQNWLFVYNWESPGCDNVNIPLSQSISGGTRVMGLPAGDGELVELSMDVPQDFGVFFAGWNAENVPAGRTVCIHHPAGDIKKISFNNDPLTSGTFFGTPNSHWTVGNWEDGTTEGGSSGSAIYDEEQRIVGMLSGGQASCFNNSFDLYGKMSFNWDTGNTASNRLQDWLDPDDTGVLVLDGRSCSVNFQFNAALNIQEPLGEFCELTIVPSVNFSNGGMEAINVMAVEYFIDNNPPQTSVWTGNLASGASVDFNLGALVGVEGAHTFTACINNINGLSSDDNIEDNCQTVNFTCADLALGIENNTIAFDAFPNPASDVLNVDLSPFAGNDIELSLLDLSGRRVLNIQTTNDQVSLAIPQSLANGTYLLSVRGSQLVSTKKINILR